MNDGGTAVLPPASPAEFALSWLWHAAMFAMGVWFVMVQYTEVEPKWWLQATLYFTSLSALLVTLVAGCSLVRPLLYWGVPARRRLEGDYGWFRGMAMCSTVLTGLVYNFLMQGPVDRPDSYLPHVVLPAMAAIDWLVIGRNQTRLPAWIPLTWAVALAPYFLAYVWAFNEWGEPMYDFLDPSRDDWWPWVFGFVGFFLILAYAMWGLGRLRGIGQKRTV